MNYHYIITNGKGSYIGRDSLSGGKYVEVKGKKYAFHFVNQADAKKILNNNVSKEKRKVFFVDSITLDLSEKANKTTEDKITEECENDAAEIITKEVLIKELSNNETSHNNCQDFIEIVNNISSLLKDVDSRFTEDTTALSEADKQIVDIEHYIEFGKFNASEGYKACKMLQGVLKKRRTIKNDRECINLIRTCNLSTNGIDKLKESITKIVNEDKTYTPRLLDELFEGMDSVTGGN